MDSSKEAYIHRRRPPPMMVVGKEVEMFKVRFMFRSRGIQIRTIKTKLGPPFARLAPDQRRTQKLLCEAAVKLG